MVRLHAGEKLAFGIIALLAAMLWALRSHTESVILWSAFMDSFLLCGAIVAAGLAMRLSARLANFSVTFVALGLYPVYSSLLALVCYMNFPLRRPLIDEQLFALDAAIGFDWARAVEWLGAYPLLARALALVYMTSLAQLLLLLIVLGLFGRVAWLHRFMVTGMLAGVMMCAFWMLWPSFGPSAYLHPAPEAMARASLVVTPEYGAQLMQMAEQGIGVIDRHQILGTVAFPSFHIFMAVLAVWFARGTFLFVPFVALNALMVPATAIHGGHHLIDLPAGCVLFALAYLLSGWLLGTARERLSLLVRRAPAVLSRGNA